MRRDGVIDVAAAAQHPTGSRMRTVSLACRFIAIVLLASFATLAALPVVAAETFDIGLGTSGSRIDASAIVASTSSAPTVVLIGGLHGEDASASAVRSAVAAYARRGRRAVNVLAVPVANPDGAALAFPPSGVAYREHAESNVLWRWLGAQAPDLVLVAGKDDSGLLEALNTEKVADMGRIPARHWSGKISELTALSGTLDISEAHSELQRRRARSPQQFAEELATHYGHDFDQPWYINAIALVARVRLGDVEDVRRIVEPYLDGTKDSLAHPSALVMGGHIIFTELARRTGDPRYVAMVRKVADLGFDASGQMLEAMPYNDQFSDSVFMGTVIVAQAGALTAEKRYFDMADRHLRYMEKLDLRSDGLYRHQPATDAAWGRGNGFAALGLALTLSELPHDHVGYAHALQSYRALMAALLPFQTRDGLWRNVIDHPGAYPEFSATAMIGFAMQRGLQNGWLDGANYRQAVDRAWLAVNSRTSSTGSFIDVCESTARMTSLQQYLQRAAILGNDARGGAMAMLFATERINAQGR
jgi:unsaturated rhamnogalacturonyl hydrolase